MIYYGYNVLPNHLILQEKFMEKESYSAFPSTDNRVQFSGMSLRDYFATKAMQGELASQSEDYEWSSTAKLAAYAYEVADAMMEARK